MVKTKKETVVAPTEASVSSREADLIEMKIEEDVADLERVSGDVMITIKASKVDLEKVLVVMKATATAVAVGKTRKLISKE